MHHVRAMPGVKRSIKNFEGLSVEPRFVRSADPSRDVLRKKLKKKYHTEYPVELLCYTAGRTISPDDVILAEIRLLIEANSGEFRRVWLFADRCHLVWPLG